MKLRTAPTSRLKRELFRRLKKINEKKKMITRHLFSKIHKPVFSPLCCNHKFPWGWMPPNYIHALKSQPLPKQNFLFTYNHVDTYFYENEFLRGARRAYDAVFDVYQNNGDFLEEGFASPSLSLAINILIKKKKVKPEVPLCRDVRLLGDWIQEDPTFMNRKLLGMWNQREIEHSVMAGIIGPEISHVWLQNPIKQVVKVHYICEKREDVWLFERCLFDDDPQWQIQNINEMILTGS